MKEGSTVTSPTVFVQVLPDFSEFDREVKRKAREGFEPLGKEADKAARAAELALKRAELEMTRSLRATEREAEKAARASAREFERADREMERALQKLEREAERVYKETAKEAERAASTAIKELERSTRQAEREANKEIAIAEKAAAQKTRIVERQAQAVLKAASKAQAKIGLQVKLDRKSLEKAEAELRDRLGKGLSTAAKGIGIAAGTALVAGLLQGFSSLIPALLTGVGAAIALLPASLAVATAAVGALALAFQGFGDAIKNIGDPEKFAEAIAKLAPSARAFALALRDAMPALKAIQQSVQEAFFTGLDVQLKAVVATLSGPVKTGLTGISAEFNLMAKEVGKFLQSSTAVETLNSIFTTTKNILAEFRPAIQPLLDGFSALAIAALPFVESLAGGLAQAGAEFGTFLTEMAKTGQLKDFIGSGVSILGDLGLILKDVGSIFKSVFGAASTDGESLLSRFVQLTHSVAAFFKSAEGNQALVTVFETLSTASKAVLDVIKPLLPSFGSLVTLVGGNLSVALKALSAFLTPVTKAFGDSLQPALVQINEAIKPLIPSILKFADTLGKELAKSIPDIVKGFTDLILLLVTEGVPVLIEITPLLIQMIPPMLAGVKALAALTVWFGKAVVAVVTFVKDTGKFLADTVNAFKDFGTSVGVWLAGAWQTVKKFFTDAGNAISGFFTSVKNWFSKGFDDASTATTGFFTKIGNFFSELPGKVGSWLASLPGKLVELINAAFDGAIRAIGLAIGVILFTILELPKQIPIIIGKVKTAITTWATETWEDAKTFTIQKIDEILAFLAGLGPKALAALIGLKTQVETFLFNLWTTISEFTVRKWDELITFLFGLPARALSAISAMKEQLTNFLSNLLSSARNIVVNGWNSIVDFFFSIPGRLNSLKDSFVNAGRNLINGFFSGFQAGSDKIGQIAGSIVGAIKGFINRVIGNINAGIADIDSVLPGDLPRIPFLASGGIATGPTQAIIGEAGREAVLPLDGARGRKTMAMLGAGQNGQSVVFENGAIQITFDGVIPTRAEAMRTGEAVATGSASALARRNIRLEMRAA